MERHTGSTYLSALEVLFFCDDALYKLTLTFTTEQR